MSDIRDRLHKAMDEQRRPTAQRASRANDDLTLAAFQPVREAATELRDELSSVPGLSIEILPNDVWIDLYDKHFWFGYDASQQMFVGTEQDTLWMEGGLRETPHRWESAAACIDAMIQACARYVSLIEATDRVRTRR